MNSVLKLRFKRPMKRLFFIFFIISMAFCSERENQQEVEQDQLPRTINYLALGDSYTIGQGVSPEQRWPNQLIVRIEENDFEVERSKIIAQTGWTTGNLIAALEAEALAEYNLVSLLIGVNNQFQNQDFSIFTEEFDELLEKAVQIAGNKDRVFVVSIPDYGVTPFGSSNAQQIGESIDQYNQYISDRCLASGISFINITEISRQLGDSPGALAPDNLHPSGEQYRAWVDAILPKTIELLNE